MCEMLILHLNQLVADNLWELVFWTLKRKYEQFRFLFFILFVLKCSYSLIVSDLGLLKCWFWMFDGVKMFGTNYIVCFLRFRPVRTVLRTGVFYYIKIFNLFDPVRSMTLGFYDNKYSFTTRILTQLGIFCDNI